jgi:hypothetical protein
VNPDGETHDRTFAHRSRAAARDFAAVVLEAVAPLSVLGAQALYILEPFLPARRASIRRVARRWEHPGPESAARTESKPAGDA